MSRTLLKALPVVALLGAGLVSMGPRVTGQATGLPSTKNGEWPMYTADLNGSKYSPLDQINAGNFSKLEVAWRLKTDNFGTRPEYKLEATPIMVKGVLYMTAGTRRSVIAVDAKSGEIMWTHSYREGARAAIAPRRELIGRLFTANPLIPVRTLVEVTSAREVLEYFGAGAEYERAKYYFSFVSKQTTMPRKLSFWRWPVNPASPASDIPATIYGAKAATLAALQTISTGSMIFKVDGTPFTLSGIDFSGAANIDLALR